MADDPHVAYEKSLPRDEMALAILREAPLERLLLEGVESTYTSKARVQGDSLVVDTTDEANRKSSFSITGDASFEDASLNPFNFHLDSKWNGDYTVRHSDGRVETDRFRYTGGFWDNVSRQTYRANLSMSRIGADGNPVQTYTPAMSEVKIGPDGRAIPDANGQPMRIARAAGSAMNCDFQDTYSGGREYNCNYILNDPQMGTLSINETRKSYPAGQERRAVVRNEAGVPIAITSSWYKMDAEGNLTEATVSARRPQGFGK
ncbi:MAG: hypothetical protein IPM23_11320 [Candidatus Melainabacteria bacterium]|nr:hypothetical protein [Candidatus Melainabacteria bacterium]